MKRKPTRKGNDEIYYWIGKMRRIGKKEVALRLSEFKRVWNDKHPGQPMGDVVWVDDVKIYLKGYKPAHTAILGDLESSSDA